jgi:hypothetical protein
MDAVPNQGKVLHVSALIFGINTIQYNRGEEAVA